MYCGGVWMFKNSILSLSLLFALKQKIIKVYSSILFEVYSTFIFTSWQIYPILLTKWTFSSSCKTLLLCLMFPLYSILQAKKKPQHVERMSWSLFNHSCSPLATRTVYIVAKADGWVNYLEKTTPFCEVVQGLGKLDASPAILPQSSNTHREILSDCARVCVCVCLQANVSVLS